MYYIHDIDFPITLTAFDGRVHSVRRTDGKAFVILFGTHEDGRPGVLTIRLKPGIDARKFRPLRRVRITEVLSKLGREMLISFPAARGAR